MSVAATQQHFLPRTSARFVSGWNGCRGLMAALLSAAALGMGPTGVLAQNRTDPTLPPFTVHMTVDASKSVGELKPIWRFFGADEPNYATMKDGRKLMSHLGALKPGDVYFRAHNLLNTGDGTPAFKWGSTNAYTEDADGNPIYDWTVDDMIIDTYIKNGVHPYLQIGFMPEAMSTAKPGTPYQHAWRPGFDYKFVEGGWNTPPKDYKKWEELAYQWTKHNVERYGREEVSKWYFEVWNEANGSHYWTGTPEEFYKLHDYAIAGVKRALPEARVGGMDSLGAGGAFMDGFLSHVVSGRNEATGGVGTPTDFLSFHAKGQPKIIDGRVRMGISTQLKTVDEGFSKIAAVSALKSKPIVIGENDPEGCAACPSPANAYRNGTLYASYTAASYPRIWALAKARGVNLDGALTWAFEFEDQPYFAGYRQLSSNGLDLPVMNVFRLLAKMGQTQVMATSDREVALDEIKADGVVGKPDVGVLATRTLDHKLAVFVWHYHDDDLAGAPAQVELHLAGLEKSRSVKVVQWRVDGENGNAFSAWQKIGSPQSPSADQYAEMEKASAMTPQAWPNPVAVKKGSANMTFAIPRQGVTLMILEPAP